MAWDVPQGFRCLKNLMFGGEAADAGAVRRVLSAGRPARLMNVYGPTETTTFAAWHLIDELPETATTVPIGQPIANTTFYILDANRQPVPWGIPGELYIGGDGVALGYLKRPELDAEKFVANPFSTDSDRLYRTGDLVRYRHDGAVEFLGRLDNQVKIRGFRIEPGEIDAALSRHPQLHQTLTIVREDTPGDKRVVSYCVPAEGFAFEPAGLRQFLGAHLPEYMLPGAFVAMESLPINVNGKVDRSLLPLPELLRNDALGRFVAPRNSIEHSLCTIWTQLLGVEQVSIDDNFFAIGGHSLLATQLVSRIRDILKVEIPLRAIFEYQTVAGLALYLGSQHAVTGLEPIRPLADRGAAAPLSWSQQRVWFLDQLMPGTPLYNVPAITRFKGALNFPMLKRALSIVVNRHDALRATFELAQDGPVQICGPRTGLAVSFTDLSLLKPAERELKSRRLAEEEARKPFDLATGPLIRAGVIRLDSADYLLLLTMHHIVCDGWSIGILIREAVEAWQSLLRGENAELPALPLQYSDYASWQRGTLSTQLRDSNLAWWKRHLSGALPVLNLPTDRPRPAEPSLRGARYQNVLKGSAVGDLRTIAETNQSTLFMVLLAAFNALLADYSGQQDIVVGSPVAGRNRSEIENLIGFFVNTLPLRTDLSGDPTFSELLRRVRETALGAFANQDVPFEMIVDETAPGRSRSQNPLFQVAFVLQNATNFRVDLPGLVVEVQETDSGYSKFDLTLVAQETDGNLALSWEYRADLFDQATIARMAYHFETFLEAVTADPDRRISELRLLTDAERQGLIRPENQIDTVYSPASDAPGSADTGPQSEFENTLIEIWRQVLGLSTLGIHDNFFEAGGDSILSIQVIARARAAGLHLTPRDIFDNQTIAALAAVARSLPAIDCEQHPVTGPAPLTPIQHWFFEQNLADAHHWNQSILLKFSDIPDPIALQEALDAVLNHHDALRARFHRTAQGWDQTIAPPDQPISLRFFDLSAHGEPTVHLERLASDIQASKDLANGPLLHAAVFRLGDREWRLLIAIHHLVIDGVSWRILVEDLHTAYDAICSGRAAQLPPKTTSYREWGEKLAAETGSPETQIEGAYWRSIALAEYIPLPLDNPIDPAANTRGNCDSATVTLEPGETAQLLREVPKAYRTQINDVLLTALPGALRRWTGMSSFLVDLESHGRDALPAGVDVTRTVGWFTSTYPVRLNLPDGDNRGRALTSIKEQLRRVPRNGVGYGILRYRANDELARELASAPIPEVSFNYLGQFDQSFGQASLFAPAMESKGKEFSPHSQRRNLLEFNGNVLGGQLHITCVYSRLAHKSATIEKLLSCLLEELKAIIVHCMTPESGAFTASDFPLARLDDEKLGKLARLISKPV
jgi:non-ribosomal peptide synthase protein (TIGR01720 family)